MPVSNKASNMKVHTSSSLFAVDHEVVSGHVDEMEKPEHKVLDDSRVRLGSTTIVAEVKALKAEVAILKRSFDEEREARKIGDSLSCEAISQLQTILEFEKKQCSASESKLEQHFEAVMSSEMANLKQSFEEEREARKAGDSLSGEAISQLQTILEFEKKQRSVLESKLGQHFEAVMSSGMANLKQSFEEEQEARKAGDSLSGEAISQLQIILDFEKKQRSASESQLGQHFEAVISSEMAKLKQTLESRPSHQTSYDIDSINDLRAFRAELDREIKNRLEQFDRRFEESHHKFESGMTEIVHGLNEERAERQGQDKAMHELLTSLAEQTNNVLEEETSPLWKALQTHNHDILIDIADQGDKKSVEALANNGCFTGKSPHIMQLNQGGFSPGAN